MAVSLAIAGVLMGAIGSAVLLATKAIPSTQSAAYRSSADATEIDSLLNELRTALHVGERTAKSIRFTIPDRDGDGKPEVIRYAWSGAAGAPLTRQVNNGTVVNLLDAIQSISFAYHTQTKSESYPGPPVEGPEQVLASHWPAAGGYSSREFKVEPDNWPGQYVVPTLPADALSWRVTKVKFRARNGGGLSDTTLVQLRQPATGGLPSATVLEQATMLELTLDSTLRTQEFSFSNVAGLAPGSGVALVLANGLRLDAASHIEWSENFGADMLETGNTGTSFTRSNSHSLIYEIHGKVTTPGTRTVTRTFITGVEICLQPISDPASWITTGCTLLNRPELTAAMWVSPMSENLTTTDRNADGQGDFAAAGGFNSTALNAAGYWQADRTLTTAPSHPMNQFTTIELRWEDATASGNGVAVGAIVDSGGLLAGVVEAVLRQESDGSGQQLLIYTRSVLILPVLLGTIDNLPSGMLDTVIYINPANNSFIVAVNGAYAGSFNYSRINLTSPGSVSLYPVSGETGGRVDHLHIRVGGDPQ